MRLSTLIFTTLVTGTTALFAPHALAASKGYDLKMEMSVNGKRTSTRRIVTMAGETAVVSQKANGEESFVEVTANEGQIRGRKGIVMNFVIGVIGKDGKRQIISQPRMLATENKKAELTIAQSTETLSLAVIPKRKVF